MSVFEYLNPRKHPLTTIAALAGTVLAPFGLQHVQGAHMSAADAAKVPVAGCDYITPEPGTATQIQVSNKHKSPKDGLYKLRAKTASDISQLLHDLRDHPVSEITAVNKADLRGPVAVTASLSSDGKTVKFTTEGSLDVAYGGAFVRPGTAEAQKFADVLEPTDILFVSGTGDVSSVGEGLVACTDFDPDTGNTRLVETQFPHDVSVLLKQYEALTLPEPQPSHTHAAH